jgi:hypothetical protein
MAEDKKAAAKDDKEAKAAEEAAAKEAEAKAKAAAAKKDAEDAEEEIERDRLIWEGTQFFGYPPHVVAGALSGMDGRKESFKPSQVADEIEKFLKRPVKED